MTLKHFLAAEGIDDAIIISRLQIGTALELGLSCCSKIIFLDNRVKGTGAKVARNEKGRFISNVPAAGNIYSFFYKGKKDKEYKFRSIEVAKAEKNFIIGCDLKDFLIKRFNRNRIKKNLA